MRCGLIASRFTGQTGTEIAMPIALIFDKTRPDTIGIYFERACRALGVAYDHWSLRDAQQIPATYDLYLRIDHGDDYLTELQAQLRPSVFYAIDTHLPHSWRKIRQVAGQYDLVCCAQRDAAARLPRAAWLPFACDPDLHGPCGASATWEVAFIGMDGGIPRKFYLQALRERYPKSRIGIADHTQLGTIYSSARIGFNYSIANDVNMRIFEVMAANALLITNALNHDDLPALGLEDGQHLVLYRTPVELFERIDYFLGHPEERIRIAQAGCDAVRHHHTYTQRLRQLLDRVSQTLGVSLASQTQEPLACAPS